MPTPGCTSANLVSLVFSCGDLDSHRRDPQRAPSFGCLSRLGDAR